MEKPLCKLCNPPRRHWSNEGHICDDTPAQFYERVVRERAAKPREVVTAPECPKCAKRDAAKAASMRRYRAKRRLGDVVEKGEVR